MQVAQISPAQMGGNPLTAFQQGRQALAQAPINLRAGQGAAPGQAQQYMMSNALTPQRNIQMAGKAPAMIDYHKDQRERDEYRRQLEKKFVDQQIKQENNALTHEQDIAKSDHEHEQKKEMGKIEHDQSKELGEIEHGQRMKELEQGNKFNIELAKLEQDLQMQVEKYRQDLKIKFEEKKIDLEKREQEILNGNYGAHLADMIKATQRWQNGGRKEYLTQLRNEFITSKTSDPNVKAAFNASPAGKKFNNDELKSGYFEALEAFIDQSMKAKGDGPGGQLATDFDKLANAAVQAKQQEILGNYYFALRTGLERKILFNPNPKDPDDFAGNEAVRKEMQVPTIADGVAAGTIDPSALARPSDGSLRDGFKSDMADLNEYNPLLPNEYGAREMMRGGAGMTPSTDGELGIGNPLNNPEFLKNFTLGGY